ncbi:GNAT family N-acetyltransferase [Bacillus weihaiensis]|nr:GNAT family N-acetyltransferase [Bacillus weihaiensis]
MNPRFDRDQLIANRRDSFLISFGHDKGFGEEDDYIFWLEEQVEKFPNGFVFLVNEKNHILGQIEVSIRSYENRKIGYVHLYYLVKEYRGRGFGKRLHDYSLQFFKENQVSNYHLRVSPTNVRALFFYEKMGLVKVGEELDGKVIRMEGKC